MDEVHRDREARFTSFAGWEMPVSFASIRAEHEAVRADVGVFDVSHMGQVAIEGPDAGRLCQRLAAGDVERLSPGEAQYTTILRTDGTIIDDAILYRLGPERYLLVPNAGQDERMVDRWADHRGDLDVTVTNRTTDWGMLAVQGPASADRLPVDVAELDRMAIQRVSVASVECWCARTGYTGERGYELLVPWDRTPDVDAAIEATRCGLGARDTLRLEMGYVLAGNEFDDEDNRRTPFEARLDATVDLATEPPCIGRDALQDAAEPDELRVGLRMEERAIPRSGYELTDGSGTTIGTVTSGTMSPTLEEPIGLGYVEASHASPGTSVGVDVRGTERMASIVTLPFVDTE